MVWEIPYLKNEKYGEGSTIPKSLYGGGDTIPKAESYSVGDTIPKE